MMLADYFEGAFIGMASRFDFKEPVAVYDYDKCIEILVNEHDLEEEQALEYFSYNVLGSWVGDETPVFLHRLTLDEAVSEWGQEEKK